LWIAYLELGKVIQRMSKSEILIIKLNKSSTLVQRSFHMPVIVKIVSRVCGREWTHAKELIEAYAMKGDLRTQEMFSLSLLHR
jgi:hypothetical protein